jgi:rare lipoprotein A
MRNNSLQPRFRSLLTLCAAGLLVGGGISRCLAQDASAASEPTLKNTQATRNAEKIKHHIPDFSARTRMGKASFYANEFAGRKMADGARMDPHGDNAASKTLPLGTTAKVTNLETGKSAVVTIQDRGPYVPGRIVDLSPDTARQIGISHRKGVALVAVAPIAVPQPDGGIKLGAAAHEALATTSGTNTSGTKAIRDASIDTRTVQR